MNYKVIFKSLLIVFAFSGLSLITSFIAEDLKEKPTEESYLKSDYYLDTKTPYSDAMIIYEQNNMITGIGAIVLLGIGLLIGGCYYYLNKEGLQSTAEVKG